MTPTSKQEVQDSSKGFLPSTLHACTAIIVAIRLNGATAVAHLLAFFKLPVARETNKRRRGSLIAAIATPATLRQTRAHGQIRTSSVARSPTGFINWEQRAERKWQPGQMFPSRNVDLKVRGKAYCLSGPCTQEIQSSPPPKKYTIPHLLLSQKSLRQRH